ncbi:hypothetical protein [Clostridium sp. BNL1100]|uniref:hypothetical protein n=1 Tax=Clostridium sp. BNL1100 TaxID=755731 RepID=UPI00024A7DC4|nr:hypothetical protein [Clostridium sp. BNL1100]AEY65385.1 hypothetical protein Clo1100_1133 [Clostridium sp. BNL1100]
MSLSIPKKTVLYSDGSTEDFGEIEFSNAQEDAAIKLLIHILKTTGDKNDGRLKSL